MVAWLPTRTLTDIDDASAQNRTQANAYSRADATLRVGSAADRLRQGSPAERLPQGSQAERLRQGSPADSRNPPSGRPRPSQCLTAGSMVGRGSSSAAGSDAAVDRRNRIGLLPRPEQRLNIGAGMGRGA